MDNLKYFEILNKKKELQQSNDSKPLEFKVLSNITTNQLNDIAEYYLLSRNLNVIFSTGNYDNIVQDVQISNNFDGLLFFWEAANIIPGLHYKINLFTEDEFQAVINKVKTEIDLIGNSLKNVPLVLFNKFSSVLFNAEYLMQNRLDELCSELNEYAKKKLPSNVFMVDIDKIIAQISVQKAFNSREYVSSRALYSLEFNKAYTKYIAPVILSAHGKTKKALIFDCDNTLWNGILGEDGPEGIMMSEHEKAGNPFFEIQNLALQLCKNGVIIGLCSKNNEADVEYILGNHPDIVLKPENITIKKINWNNKAQNLIEIAHELNIGLDSIVFVDDSDFEINLINEQLPQVTTIQVPNKRHMYPGTIKEAFSLFFNKSLTEEDKNKSSLYTAQFQRKEAMETATSIDEYLKSLQMEIHIFKNNTEIVPRMAQMTQKTNQFNLTTKRYTESQIQHFVDNSDFDIFALNVADKFGDNGITGLAIVKYSTNHAIIDTFLMSCRIIGRNIEYKFMNYIIHQIHRPIIYANYIESAKNQQTMSFLDQIGFKLIKKTNRNTEYKLRKGEYQPNEIEYILEKP